MNVAPSARTMIPSKRGAVGYPVMRVTTHRIFLLERSEMARETEIVTRQIVEHLDVTTITCDKCGRQLDEDDDGELFANVLEIYCNLNQCVNDRVYMDLCTGCLAPIWSKICEAIGADPATILRIGQDD